MWFAEIQEYGNTDGRFLVCKIMFFESKIVILTLKKGVLKMFCFCVESIASPSSIRAE